MEKAKAPGFDAVGDALRRGASSPPAWVDVDGQRVPLVYRRNATAKRYRLFVDRDGQARVTIPRRGTQYEAREFVAQHQDWLLNQLRRFAQRKGAESVWGAGTEVLFRGLKVCLEVSHGDGHGPGFIRVGADHVPVNLPDGARPGHNAVREAVERHWRQLAEVELPQRTEELAARHGCVVRRVHVRSQRTRWGSCSRRGVVSLNWRLVQVPETVRDYIILHELMHLREMNHSRRFWTEVERACPGFRDCEAWLRAHSRALL